MDPRLLSPIQAGIRSFGDIQKGLLGQQEAQQSGIETGFLPQQLHTALQQALAKAQEEQYRARHMSAITAAQTQTGGPYRLIMALLQHKYPNIFGQSTGESGTGSSIMDPKTGIKYIHTAEGWVQE